MSRPSTCLPCRARKVKCDGALPFCNRCVRTNRSASCTYDLPLHKKHKVSALQKGEACIPCRTKKKRCDATRPICQRCSVARYQDECMYDAASPEPVELSSSQTRRLMARRTSISGDTPRPDPSPVPGPSRRSPPSDKRFPDPLLNLLPPGHPMKQGEDVLLVPPSQAVQPTASTSFAHVQPLQKRTDYSSSYGVRSHYRPQQTHYDQNYPTRLSSNAGETEPATETAVILRTTALVPSSPLLKSTVSNSRASEAAFLREYSHNEYPIQADPASPYYLFQDTRLIPNPIIRIIMANETNPRMFSLQNISPDTLSLLFRFEFVSHLVQFGLFLPVAKLQAIILNDTSGTFVHPCLVHIANLMGCHLHQDNRLDYSLNHLELLHLNTVCQSLEEMDRYSQTQPRFHVPGQSYGPPNEGYDRPMKGEAEDPFTYAQIRFLLFLYVLLWRCTSVSSRLLRSVFYLVERNQLRFVPEHRLAQLQRERQGHAGFAGDGSPVAEFSEPDYERASLMTSLLGADAGLQLFGLERRPELSWLDLERQFFDEFPAAYPTLSQMPLVWRNRGLLILNHAASLQKQHLAGKDVIQSCKDLISSHFFMIEGLQAVIASHEDDHEGHLLLRCSAVVAHTAMAVLLRTLSQALTAGQGNSSVPTQDQTLPIVYRRRCRKALKEAIKITRGLADPDFPFIDVTMAPCWFRLMTMVAEMDNEDVAMGISPERESPPPSIPPASSSPTIRSAQPVTRADQIRRQQAQYSQEHHQRHQDGSPPTQTHPPPSSASASQSSRSSSESPPHQATISEVYDDSVLERMPAIDEVEEVMSDLQVLEKSSKKLQSSFWRPVPDVLTNKMHRLFEGLKVVMENQEGVYTNG